MEDFGDKPQPPKKSELHAGPPHNTDNPLQRLLRVHFVDDDEQLSIKGRKFIKTLEDNGQTLRETAVILGTSLDAINTNGGLIQDINDDQGLAVRQIGLSPFDQQSALIRIKVPKRV